jgi:hypothetical protein
MSSAFCLSVTAPMPGRCYPFPFPWFGPRFVLEPQGQIIWQEVSFQGANNGLGPVGLGTTSRAAGRLGLRGKWTFTGANGIVWQPYVQANIWRDWGAEANTTFGVDQAPLIEQPTRLAFAGGITARFGPRLSLFAQGRQVLQQLALAIQLDAYFYSKGAKHRCSWQGRYLRSEDFWFDAAPKKSMGVNLDVLTAIANLTPDKLINECRDSQKALPPVFVCPFRLSGY